MILIYLKTLLYNLDVDDKMLDYLMTLILCFCGDSTAWINLFIYKLEINENNKSL